MAEAKAAASAAGNAVPAAGTVPALHIDKLRAGYGPTVVLEDVCLTLPERGALALLGRNGVGKTTLLASIMGHSSFHGGAIHYRGKAIHALEPHERSRLGIGYVPQTRDVFPSLTVEENLAVAARPGRWPMARVYELFPRLAERRGHMGNQISGGEQQMLSIGRALMGDPALLLLDEPLEGLAPIIVQTLLKSIERLIREEALTVILVEQSVRLALEVTQQAIVLNRGRIAYSGESAALLADAEKLSALVMAG
ncbi:MAG: ABC transporter ATP-binding protein [Burkholderiales bacterium]|nr:ABC transporter ATP-binding protein [Burkholderiales bacterium]